MHNHTDKCNPRLQYSDRCARFLRLWSLLSGKMAATRVAPQWSTVHIMSKELRPIVLSYAVWGPFLARQKVLFQCDNSGVIVALQKGSARNSTVMHVLCCLWFFVAHYNIVLMSEHIAGVDNCTDDRLSRHHMHSFFSINPQASPITTPLSPLLLQLLTPSGPDWISATFKQLFFLLSKRPSHLHYKLYHVGQQRYTQFAFNTTSPYFQQQN